jgi:hypothetical protein
MSSSIVVALTAAQIDAVLVLRSLHHQSPPRRTPFTYRHLHHSCYERVPRAMAEAQWSHASICRCRGRESCLSFGEFGRSWAFGPRLAARWYLKVKRSTRLTLDGACEEGLTTAVDVSGRNSPTRYIHQTTSTGRAGKRPKP